MNIDDAVHQQGVRELESSLIGRIMLKMGVKHMSTSELNASIDRVWNIKGE